MLFQNSFEIMHGKSIGNAKKDSYSRVTNVASRSLINHRNGGTPAAVFSDFLSFFGQLDCRLTQSRGFMSVHQPLKQNLGQKTKTIHHPSFLDDPDHNDR